MIDFFKARTASWNLWRQKSRRVRRTEARQRRAAEVLEPREVLTAVFGVNEANELIRFDSASPQTVVTVGAITGLQQGEQVRGIDFRPATGQLYALGIVEGDTNASGRVYTLDILSGAATQVGSSTFSTALAANADWGFDFNPVPDRIRVINDNDQNLRLNPSTGALAGTDTTLAYGAPDANVGDDPELAAVAYSNNTGGATATTLYGIDFNGGVLRLVRQGGVDGSPSPNLGELSTVGSLGQTAASADIGFDIDSHSGRAFAAYQVSGTTSLFSVNLTSGAATSVNTIGDGSFVVRDIAVINQPAASTAIAYAVNASGQLIRFAVNAPAAPTVIGTITGLQSGEVIKGIDFRPSTGQLFALGITDVMGTDSSRVYTLNTTTAVATAVGSVAATSLSDTAGYGFDFNPVPDRIRVNNTDDQNIRLNPTTGGLAGTDTNLAFDAADTNNGQNPSIVGAAYSHSLANSTSTTLYVIDGGLNVLARQGSPDSTPTSPNAGVLFTVGSLGITLGSQNAAFDIRGGLGTAFAALDNQATGLTGLYTLNLTGTSNVATFVGTIGDGSSDILAMAIAPETHLEVFLSNAGDTVTVDVSGGNLRVRNGTTDLVTPTSVGAVNSLRIYGGTGNDTVNVDATLANTYTGAFTFLGGAGVDGLLAGSATFGIRSLLIY